MLCGDDGRRGLGYLRPKEQGREVPGEVLLHVHGVVPLDCPDVEAQPDDAQIRQVRHDLEQWKKHGADSRVAPAPPGVGTHCDVQQAQAPLWPQKLRESDNVVAPVVYST